MSVSDGHESISHAVVVEAERTCVRIKCPIHGDQTGLRIPGPDAVLRICEACWMSCCARLQPILVTMMDSMPRFYPGRVEYPAGFESFRRHLTGGP